MSQGTKVAVQSGPPLPLDRSVPVSVRLLGPPSIEHDGRPVALRGHKAWGLLAYLLLAPQPPSRTRLADLLFADAADPQAALRWNLAEVRRGLGAAAEIHGSPVVLRLRPTATVDVLAVVGSDGPVRPDLVGGELLEGMTFPACALFECWLLVERQRVAAGCEAALTEAALGLLADGRPADAVGPAAGAVHLAPLDSEHHAVLVRSLVQSGASGAARAQAARCADLFRRELGTGLPAAVQRALQPPAYEAGPPLVSRRTTARSCLEAGRAAVAAGAVERGLDQLRRAVTAAEQAGETGLHAEALVVLAAALIHSTGARDAGCTELLHRALRDGERAGRHDVLAAACRELGFLAVQLGRREQATAWLDRAERLADDEEQLAAVLGVRGMSFSDAGSYGPALDALGRSVATAEAAGAGRQAAWSRSLVGRVHLLRGDLAQAAEALTVSLDGVRATRWTAFQPWPQSLLGEVHLAEGDVGVAGELLERAYASAVELADHCWIGVAARGLARVALARGDRDTAVQWIGEGLRPVPWYAWVGGYVLDAACFVTPTPSAARSYAARLAELAARTGMRELVVRAQWHAGRFGDHGAAAAARFGAADIDNPALLELVSSSSARGCSP